MRKSTVPQNIPYRPRNAKKSKCPYFLWLRHKNALKLKGSDMGMPLPKMQEDPQSSTCYYFGLKMQENPNAWPCSPLLS